MNSKFLSRRDLLINGSLATALTLSGGFLRLARAGDGPLTPGEKAILGQLITISQGTDAKAVQHQFADAWLDPALPALTYSVLHDKTQSLSAFQTALFNAILVATGDPAALSALRAQVSGMDLTPEQKISLNWLREALLENRAVQLLLSTGKSLRDSPQLPGYVSNIVAVSLLPPPAPTPTGNAAFDSIMQDLARVAQSPQFASVAKAVTPILQSPDILPFLRRLPPGVVVNFLPPSQLTALVLPGDHVPDPTCLQEAAKEALVEFGTGFVGDLTNALYAVGFFAAVGSEVAEIGAIAAIAAATPALQIAVLVLGIYGLYQVWSAWQDCIKKNPPPCTTDPFCCHGC